MTRIENASPNRVLGIRHPAYGAADARWVRYRFCGAWLGRKIGFANSIRDDPSDDDDDCKDHQSPGRLTARGQNQDQKGQEASANDNTGESQTLSNP